MFILPVIDILGGVVVRGVAGQRATYRPIVSQLCSDVRPLAIAEALRSQFELQRLYIADLDGILQQRHNLAVFRELSQAGFELWIDVGLQTVEQAQQLRQAGAYTLIAGLESLPDPGVLGQMVDALGPDQFVFSLDLQAGRPLVPASAAGWMSLEPATIADQAIRYGLTRLIVLDLAQVGMDQGLSTLSLCQQVKTRHPHLQVVTGGGVRGPADLQLLQSQNIDGVLIASALHDGRLHRKNLTGLGHNGYN